MKPNKTRIPNLLSWKNYSIVGLVFLTGLVLMLIARGHDNSWVRFIAEIGAFSLPPWPLILSMAT